MSVDTDIGRAITWMKEREGIPSGLPGIDCGACGAPNCSAFAEDVVRGEATAEDCVFIAMRHFENLSATLLDKVRAHSEKVRHTGGPTS